MAKLVDAHDSGSCEEILGGSSPPIDILFFLILEVRGTQNSTERSEVIGFKRKRAECEGLIANN